MELLPDLFLVWVAGGKATACPGIHVACSGARCRFAAGHPDVSRENVNREVVYHLFLGTSRESAARLARKEAEADELPKPIDQGVADLFNQLFGRG